MADTQNNNTIESPAKHFVNEAEATLLNPDDDSVRERASTTLEFSAKIAAELKNKDKSADIALKKMYGKTIIVVLLLWEIFVIFISCWQLIPRNIEFHYASDTVIIALWTSATANILALPAIILKYLFPNKT